jgi:hypothetical protein
LFLVFFIFIFFLTVSEIICIWRACVRELVQLVFFDRMRSIWEREMKLCRDKEYVKDALERRTCRNRDG